MRRVLLTTAAIATLACAAILVACEFDDARAVAVLLSIPRTLGAAGTCFVATPVRMQESPSVQTRGVYVHWQTVFYMSLLQGLTKLS